MDYLAILPAPLGKIGICYEDDALTRIDFLSSAFSALQVSHPFAERVSQQLLGYFENPDAQFTVPLRLYGTIHQNKVWQAMLAIPRGQTRTYGELAAELHSSAQAVGQACGANPISVIVPCHRVVAKAGLGGFMKSTGDETLDIKRWLLAHEQR